jgi:hypothetical protein
MANIAFLGNFRFDFSSETHHVKSLESLGHSVVKLQENRVSSQDVYHVASKSDLFIWVHTHGWKTPGNFPMEKVLEKLRARGIPSMTYHLDLWLGLERQKDLDSDPIYKHIDHFFTVDSKMADWFNENTNVKGHYMPAGVFGEEAYYKPITKRLDLAFVGSKGYHPEWPYRPQLIDWLSENYGQRFRHYGNGGVKAIRGDELNTLYGTTKIVVGDTLCPNFNYPSYWSDRVYETLGRGGFIIHPYIQGMEKEFTDKEHLVFYEYNNFDQLKELIDYYLEHDEEREKIRLAGHNLVKNNYTYTHRWQSILKELGVE